MARFLTRLFDPIVSPARFGTGLLARRYRKMGLRSRQIELPTGSVHVWEGGARSDRPLLLLQGFGGPAMWQWHQQVHELTAHHWVLMPDLLYFGDSRSHWGERSLAYQGANVLALLDHFGIERCDTMGISYGGFVAWWLANQEPARLRRLILVDCPASEMTSDDWAGILDELGVDHIGDLLLPQEPAQIRRLFEIAWYRPPWIPGFALKDVHRRMFVEHRDQQRELLEELLSHLDEDLSMQEVSEHPTMLVWGEHDRIFPVQLGRRLKQRLGPRCELHVLRETAHAPNLEARKAFNQLVLRFLAD